MVRPAEVVVLIWLFGEVLAAHATSIDKSPRPTVLLRTTGQFIAQSAEKHATLYDLEGNTLRLFGSPTRIGKIELSTDEKLVRIYSEKNQVNCYEIVTGTAVPLGQFVGVTEPTQIQFRIEEVRNKFGEGFHLELVDDATGNKVRRLGTFDLTYSAIWLANGEADIRVANRRNGGAQVGVFRFNPQTGAFSELFWCPVRDSFLFLDDMAFDPHRRIGVKTYHEFVTVVFDLRTGQELFRVDNSANYLRPPRRWDTPIGQLNIWEVALSLAGLLAFLASLFVGVRFVWKLVRRRTSIDDPRSPSSQDYGEPPGR